MPTFLFAVHNHQPVGNFEFVFEKAFRDCYLPFLREVKKHPTFRWTLHFSGPLWEHMKSKEKECWDLVRESVELRRVELLGGGFYEPILPVIPERDRLGQIELMNSFLAENFGQKPRGAWLAERVWEPHLAKSLAQAGIEYTLLDEEHFRGAGVKSFNTALITEEEGFPLRLFPIDKKLRYLIPFRGLDEIKSRFNEIAGQGGVAILGDDGEKFGLWPGTHKWVYEEGWLSSFLTFLERENVRMLTYSEYLDEFHPSERVYLPPASYEEMLEWVLEPEDHALFQNLKASLPQEARRFLRGGFFRDFFLKYPESNHLHKRMILVSKEIEGARANAEAKRELYQGQGNDPYWHGVFGGLYLPHLRRSAYRHLIQAEKGISLKTGWQRIDLEIDGRDEFIWRGEEFNLFLRPNFGGSIVEIDDLSIPRNITDVLSRRRESYHAADEAKKAAGKSIHELTKEIPPGTEELLLPDRYPRYSARDHFLSPDTTLEKIRRGDYDERGDFANGNYFANLKQGILVLEREGMVRTGDESLPVYIRKTIRPGKKDLRVEYRIENRSDREIALLFGSEWNFSFLPEEVRPKDETEIYFIKSLVFAAEGARELGNFPVRTLSQSEEGYDIIIQGICLVPLWTIALAKGRTFSAEVRISRVDVS